VQKEKFSADFQKLYYRAEACIYANEAYFEFKKKRLPLVSSMFKKSVLKLLDRTVYFSPFIATGRLYLRCHRKSHSTSDFGWEAYGLDVLCARTIKWRTHAVGGAYSMHSTHGGNEKFINYDGRKIVGKESLENLDVKSKTYPNSLRKRKI
jgi:hypothetical protein